MRIIAFFFLALFVVASALPRSKDETKSNEVNHNGHKKVWGAAGCIGAVYGLHRVHKHGIEKGRKKPGFLKGLAEKGAACAGGAVLGTMAHKATHKGDKQRLALPAPPINQEARQV